MNWCGFARVHSMHRRKHSTLSDSGSRQKKNMVGSYRRLVYTII